MRNKCSGARTQCAGCCTDGKVVGGDFLCTLFREGWDQKTSNVHTCSKARVPTDQPLQCATCNSRQVIPESDISLCWIQLKIQWALLIHGHSKLTINSVYVLRICGFYNAGLNSQTSQTQPAVPSYRTPELFGGPGQLLVASPTSEGLLTAVERHFWFPSSALCRCDYPWKLVTGAGGLELVSADLKGPLYSPSVENRQTLSMSQTLLLVHPKRSLHTTQLPVSDCGNPCSFSFRSRLLILGSLSFSARPVNKFQPALGKKAVLLHRFSREMGRKTLA